MGSVGSESDFIMWFATGDEAFAEGRYDDAAAAFEKALSIIPSSVSARARLARSHDGAGRAAEALGYARQILEDYPDHAEMRELLDRMESTANSATGDVSRHYAKDGGESYTSLSDCVITGLSQVAARPSLLFVCLVASMTFAIARMSITTFAVLYFDVGYVRIHGLVSLIRGESLLDAPGVVFYAGMLCVTLLLCLPLYGALISWGAAAVRGIEPGTGRIFRTAALNVHNSVAAGILAIVTTIAASSLMWPLLGLFSETLYHYYPIRISFQFLVLPAAMLPLSAALISLVWVMEERVSLKTAFSFFFTRGRKYIYPMIIVLGSVIVLTVFFRTGLASLGTLGEIVSRMIEVPVHTIGALTLGSINAAAAADFTNTQAAPVSLSGDAG